MATIEGSRSVEIDAPADRCYALVADFARAPEWQAALHGVTVLEHDDAGRATLVDTAWDAKVRTINATLRLSFEPKGVSWRQERGDLKALSGSWTIEDLGATRCRATYALAAEPSGMLGLLLRGGAEQTVREHLLADATEGLRRQAEAA